MAYHKPVGGSGVSGCPGCGAGPKGLLPWLLPHVGPWVWPANKYFLVVNLNEMTGNDEMRWNYMNLVIHENVYMHRWNRRGNEKK